MRPQRTGSFSVALILAGVFLVLLVVVLGAMNGQAKASTMVQSKLKDANNRLASAGLAQPAVDEPTILPISQKTKQYRKDKTSFNYPDNLIVKEGNDGHVQFASKSTYFDSAAIPKGEVLVDVQRNLKLSLPTIETYLQSAPYATSHSVVTVAGHQVLKLTNKFNNTEWNQAVIAQSPQGPYDFVTVTPNDSNGQKVLDTIINSYKFTQ